MLRGSIVPNSPLIRNRNGIALLYLVILFTLLGVLVSAGSRMLGAMVTQRKITDSKAELERDVRIITAWGVRNNRLPVAGEFVGVFGSNPQDAWGKTIVYAYDSDLTASASGGLCGRTGTTGQEVAFLFISGGDDMNITSTPSIASGVVTGLMPNEDLYRIVTLKELQAQAGCAGSSQGSLKILNNELPKACAGSTVYPAALFANGGVPAYIWSLPAQSPSPWAPIQIGPTTGIFSPNTRITTTPGNYTVTVQLTDSMPTSLQRSYTIKVSILGSCSAACAADVACSAACAADPACRTACSADSACAAACPACVL